MAFKNKIPKILLLCSNSPALNCYNLSPELLKPEHIESSIDATIQPSPTSPFPLFCPAYSASDLYLPFEVHCDFSSNIGLHPLPCMLSHKQESGKRAQFSASILRRFQLRLRVRGKNRGAIQKDRG